MPNLDECRKPDGSTDWTKYQELQRAELEDRKSKGEICQRKNCNRFIVWAKGCPQTCSDCRALDSQEELHHPSEIRCPKCGYHWSVFDGEDYDLHGEGEHEVSCPDCNHTFEISTSITWSFQSPERLEEDGDNTEQEAS